MKMHNTLALILAILINGSLMFAVNSVVPVPTLGVAADTSEAQAPRAAVAPENLPEVLVTARRG